MIWNRKEVKARGKVAFKANYWKCVLAAFLMMALIFGGFGTVGRRSKQINLNLTPDPSSVTTQQNSDGTYSVTVPSPYNDDSITISDLDEDAMESLLEELNDPNAPQSIHFVPPEIQQYISQGGGGPDLAALMLVLLIVAGVLGIVILLGSLVKLLVMNPLEVGCKGFFLHNSTAPASLNEIGDGFRDWGRNVWIMFLRDLFTCLWGLLFIIPGVVKHYSYQLVPYLMVEYPTLRGADAITLSRKLMRGHKWNAFVLDLSFLGWEILSGLTAGLLGVFYVNPYIYATDAELYRAIREGRDHSDIPKLESE